MHDVPTPHERTGQPASGDGTEARHIAIPLVEDLVEVATAARQEFDQFCVAILEALYALERDGRSPSNEEDLEGQLGYSDGAGFRRDRPLIEDVLTDLQRREWVEIDPQYVIKLTATGREVAALTRAGTAGPPIWRIR